MNRFRICLAGLLVLTLLAAPATALAAPADRPAADEVIFGDSYTLPAGQVLDGNLIVFGGNVHIEAGATVSENLVVFGGNVDVAGSVAGDMVVIGGNVDLRAGALVEGDLVNPGGNINRETGAEVRGNLVSEFNFGWLRDVRISSGPTWFSGVWQLVQAIGLGVIALLLVLIVPEHLGRTADVINTKPMSAGGLGLLTLVLLPFVLIITLITCVLPPVILLLFIAAYVFGWVALGLELGRRLADALNADWSLLIQGTLGTFLLSLAAGFVAWIPCIGWLAGLVLASVGLGATLLSRFGTLREPVVAAQLTPKPKATKSAAPKRSPRKK
ncbi:MAG: hypothetical protein WEC16_01970 [Anaerolineales bacterium]